VPTLRDRLSQIKPDTDLGTRYKGPPALIEATEKGQEVLVRLPPQTPGEVRITRRVHPSVFSGKERTEPLIAVMDLVSLDSSYFELKKSPGSNDSVVTVGRNRDNDIVILDDTISTVHAGLQLRGQSYWLHDCGSKNGTFLNQRQLQGSEASVLDSGDCVRFGQRVFYYIPQNRLGLFFKMCLQQKR
jgi:pSer/pThr/pTyr-binding forkhead associated (FHA) protein